MMIDQLNRTEVFKKKVFYAGRMHTHSPSLTPSVGTAACSFFEGGARLNEACLILVLLLLF